MKPSNDRQVRMLITLEDVCSAGRFMTDSVVFKVVISLVIMFLIAIIIGGQLALILPTSISMLIGVLISIPPVSWFVRMFVLKQKELCRIFEEVENGGIVDTNEFSDIYTVSRDCICSHLSGHRSVFISVDRLDTIGMKNSDIDDYYDCFSKFESTLSSKPHQFSFKMYEVEDVDKYRGAIRHQISLLDKVDNNAINTTTICRSKYLDRYINAAGVDCTIVYSVYCKYVDTDTILRVVDSAISKINNRHIGNVHTMSHSEINAFGSLFFDSKEFNCINLGEESSDEIIKIEGDTL